MKKIISITSTPQQIINFEDDTSVLELGSRLQKEVSNADTPIAGELKESLRQLMAFNISPFIKDPTLKQVPNVMEKCERIINLFTNDSVTYRDIMRALLDMLETAETHLINTSEKKPKVGFKATLPLEKEVDNICRSFPKTCLMPLFRDKGLFSYELLYKHILDAEITDNTIVSISWPYPICSGWTKADTADVGPSSMGRHDRNHLGLLKEWLSTLDGKKGSNLPFVGFETATKGIKLYMANNNGSEILSMLLTYGMHEDMLNFLRVLHPKCGKDTKEEFLDMVLETFSGEKKQFEKILNELRAMFKPVTTRKKMFPCTG